ncbi:MAG: hypothetical protein Q7S21_01675 [archaeon]|nr:hypothetical protein [archaeon]
METLVKLDGVPEDVLNVLIGRGYFKTKAEAIRAGLLKLGNEYKLLESPEELELQLVALRIKEKENEMEAKNQKFVTEEEVKKKYGFK